MADRIKGITIEIGGDTTKLQTSLKGVDKQLRDTQSTLRDVNKLLKLDPANTELLTQKQKNLESAISGTKERLEQLKAAQSGVEKGTAEWDALQREIIATEQSLESLENEYRNFGSVAAQQIAVAGQKMEEIGGKVEAVGKAFAPISTAAGGALTSIGALAYKSVTAADDLNTLSKQTGISTDELQRMQYAADLVDVSVDDITAALRKMKPKLDENNETFATLGVSVTNADGSLRDATDVFYDSLKALSGISNETERDKIAMELFGKSADSLAGIIDDGGAALKEYGDEAERLGLVMSEDTLSALNEANDTIDRSKAIVGGSLAQLGATAAQVLAPALEKVAGVIDKVSEKLRNLTPEQTETIMKILGIVAAITPLLTVGGKVISGIGKIMTLAPKLITIVSAINPVTLAVVAGIAAVIAIGVALYKNWDTIKEKAAEIWQNIKTGWENAKTSVVSTVTALKDGVVNTWENMKSRVEGIIDTVRGKIDGFKQKFEDLKSTVTNAIDRIREKFNFSWSLPNISLPHFRVTAGQAPYGLGWKGYLPSISVDWYKKAYTDPVMFTSPTVLQTPQGYKGFGDGSGAEIVMGLNKLRQLVGTSGDVVINVYSTPGQNVDELADKIQQRFVALQKQREAAYA
jgi:phage-related minor tail protein